ncbi:hypothetical protein CHUAL_005414 [Chamberlinius hualienensis]
MLLDVFLDNLTNLVSTTYNNCQPKLCKCQSRRRRGSQGSNQSKGGRPYFIPPTVTLSTSTTATSGGKSDKSFSLSSSDSIDSARDNGWSSSSSSAAGTSLIKLNTTSTTDLSSQQQIQFPSLTTTTTAKDNNTQVMMTSASAGNGESSKGKDENKSSNNDKKNSKHLSAPPPGTFSYEVNTNDTLTSVAARFETTPSELVKLNRLVNRLVFPGQVIYIAVPKEEFDEEQLNESEDEAKSKSENSMDIGSQHTTQLSSSNLSSSPSNVNAAGSSPKPGRVERIGRTPSPPHSHYYHNKRSNLANSKRLSEEEEKKLDKECIERFLKINVKHITDGQGVVDGVLLVTPNAVMFDPSVVHTLVMEHGVEKYGVIAPMDYVANAALYTDIAHMKVRHAPVGCVAVTPRPEIYRGRKDHLKEDTKCESTGSGPCRSESQQAVKGSVSDKADLDLSEDDLAEEDDEISAENSCSKVKKLESRTRSGGTEADDEYSSDSEVFATEINESKTTKTDSLDQIESPVENQRSFDVEKPCVIAQNSPAASTVKVEQKLGSSFEDRAEEIAEEAEKAFADEAIINEPLKPSLKLNLDDSKIPRRRMSYEPPSPSIDGWVIATRNLLEHRRGSTPDAYVFEAVNPLVNSMLTPQQQAQLSQVPEHKGVDLVIASSKLKGHSKEDIRVEFKSEVTMDDKKDLFQAMDKLIPRPARHSDDQPLYLCLRMGRPINKKRPPSTTPIMSYGQRKMRSEYWFGIPKDRVDDLYNFFQHWAPGVYGDIEQMDLNERGFELVNSDDEESDEEIIKAPYAMLIGRLRRDTQSSDSEVVSMNEVLEAGKLKRFYSVDLEAQLPELIGKSEILTEEHRRRLFKELPPRAEGYAWSLIYSASQHGFSLQSMYRCMAKCETPVLLVIQDSSNHVFGALTSCSLKVSDHFYGTGESFLYTFYPQFKVFRWTGENVFFIKGNSESLAIGAGDGLFGLWLDGDIDHGRSHRCKTYNNDNLTEEEDFRVTLLEAWGFVDYEVPDSHC